MIDIKKYVVPWLKDAKIYSLDDLDQAWGNPELGRMMINECPIPPSEKVVEAVIEAARLGHRYPGSEEATRAKIGAIHDLGPENVYLAGGSSECIDAIMRVFLSPGAEIIIAKPTFSLYEIRALAVGARPVIVEMTEDMQYDTDAMLAAVTDKTRVIIVCSPNNPTGDFIDDGDLMRIVETGIPIFLDEAYLEFHKERSSKASLIKDHTNVLVAHTFSKAFGLAGIRFGYMLGDAEVISYFRRVQIPWSASIISIAAANAILDNPEELVSKVEHNNKYVDFFVSGLKEIPGVRPFFSHGNYVLVDATDTGKSSEEICDHVLQEIGLMIKPMGALHGRNGWFRITIGTVEENERLMGILKEFLTQ